METRSSRRSSDRRHALRAVASLKTTKGVFGKLLMVALGYVLGNREIPWDVVWALLQ